MAKMKKTATMNKRLVKHNIPMLDVQCRLLSDTINVENRTVEMVFTTTNPVRTWDWDIGEFIEILSMKEEHIRWERMKNGAPLLNSHWRFTLRDQIGVVERAWVQGNEMRGLVRFSKREDADEIFQDVVDKIIRNGSIGYRVHKYQDITEGDDTKIRTLMAIDWEPVEMSLVPVGADPAAGVRGERAQRELENECEIEIKIRNQSEGGLMDKEENQTEQPVKDVTPPAGFDVEAEREAGAKAERIRMKEIRKAVKAAKLGDEVAEQLIDDGKSVEQARAYVIDLLAKQSEENEIRNQNPSITVGRDEGETLREGLVEAILFRAGAKRGAITEKSQKFRYMRLLDMARLFVGRDSFSHSPSDVVTRAMSTSDFPLLLMDAMNKELQGEYQELPQSFDPIVRRVNLSDFKQKHIIGFGDFPELKKKNELGEIEHGVISEGKESYQAATYARDVLISRETIINDDLDAFARLPQMAARRAREKESDLVWNLITSNPTMGDGKKLFSADHTNIESTADINVTNVGKLVAKMKAQKGRDGARITILPSWLVVPVALETTAGQFLDKNFTPTKASDVNPFRSTFRGYIADPRLDDNSTTKWYVAADKSTVDIIELGTLDGEGPKINIEEKFGTGVKFQILHDIGAGLADYRGLAGNGTFA